MYSWQYSLGSTHDSTHRTVLMTTHGTVLMAVHIWCGQYSQGVVSTHGVWSVLMAVHMGCGQYSWQYSLGSTHDSTHRTVLMTTHGTVLMAVHIWCGQYSQGVVSTHGVWSVLMAVHMGCGQYSWQYSRGMISTHDSTHGCGQYSWQFTWGVVSTHRVWSVLTGCGQ